VGIFTYLNTAFIIIDGGSRSLATVYTKKDKLFVKIHRRTLPRPWTCRDMIAKLGSVWLYLPTLHEQLLHGKSTHLLEILYINF